MTSDCSMFKSFMRHSITRCIIGEFISTFILVVVSCGSVAQCVFSGFRSGHVLSSFWGSSMGVMLGVHFCYKISGAHMNPSITLGLASVGKLTWSKVPIYIMAQLSGAFVASIFVYGLYYDALNDYDNGVRNVTGEFATAHIWSTYPREFLSIINAFVEQVFNTALLMGSILALTDPNNMHPDDGLLPLLIALVVFTISCAFCFNTGASMNPAKDLGPRIFTALAGWGNGVFSYNNYCWFWIPIVAPPIGAILAALAYKFLIGVYLEGNEEASSEQKRIYKQKEYMTVDFKKGKEPLSPESQEITNILNSCVA